MFPYLFRPFPELFDQKLGLVQIFKRRVDTLCFYHAAEGDPAYPVLLKFSMPL
jgi:hypothetical protein